jgi:putative ABC transport system substrate-binding protein
MTSRRFFLNSCLGLGLASTVHASAAKKRILVVSSYHKEYLWSQSTQQGLVASLLKYRYLDTAHQADTFTRTDNVESSKAVIRKEWMDTKRANTQVAISAATQRIMAVVHEFRPDLVMLGDDNAAHYIGNQLLDTPTPVVFWGVNGLPLKYGLVDSMDQPGHNVTGVWQQGYFKESFELLHQLVPAAKTFAILSCDSETARPSVKQIQVLAGDGQLPLRLAGTVVTNSFDEFKKKALELSKKVDAFFMLNHDIMKDSHGNHVDMMVVGRWYLENIRKPEATIEDQFVQEGMLLTANDYGYNQSYLAFEMAYDILEQGLNPGRVRPKTPSRGPLMVNRKRAQMLGIPLSDEMRKAVQLVDSMAALAK